MSLIGMGSFMQVAPVMEKDDFLPINATLDFRRFPIIGSPVYTIPTRIFRGSHSGA